MVLIPQTPRPVVARIRCFLIMVTNERREGGVYNGRILFDIIRQDDDSLVLEGVTGIDPDGPTPPPPGSMWWHRVWKEKPAPGGTIFSNGDHLALMTPGGWMDLDARALDCTRRGDMIHRCHTRKGRPPNITLTKVRPTCEADDILVVGDYRGFLWDGELIEAREIVSEPGTR